MNRTTKTKFRSTWWSIHVPPGWHAREDDQCVTLTGNALPSAFQLSAAKKESGSVTDEDLKDYASQSIRNDAALSGVNTGAFCGFYAEYVENGTFWREWWLRADNLLVYATYNVDEKFKVAETTLVDGIVNSLRPV